AARGATVAEAATTFTAAISETRRSLVNYVRTENGEMLTVAREGIKRMTDASAALTAAAPDMAGNATALAQQYQQRADALIGTVDKRQKALSAVASNGARLSNAAYAIAIASAERPELMRAAFRMDRALQTTLAALGRYAGFRNADDAETATIEF